MHQEGFSDLAISRSAKVAFTTIYYIRTRGVKPREVTRRKIFDAMIRMLKEKREEEKRQIRQLEQVGVEA
jgi:hypothetical protein